MSITQDNSDSVSRESPSIVDEPSSSGVLAKEYTLDIPRIPSLELPLHVSAEQSSIQKAVTMCGGIRKVKEAFREGGNVESQNGLELYLNEGKNPDGTSLFFNEHSITGKRVPFRDDSIILKITMPRGTMEKNRNNIQQSLASLDSKQYRVTPVGIVNNTIKFREMSDFQVRLDNVPSANEFKDSFETLDWSNFKKFVQSVPDNDSRPFENINNLILDRTSACPSTDFQLPPPPKLSMVGYPLLYKYKGNPLATKKSDGKAEVKAAYIKNYQLFLHTLDKDTKPPTEPHQLLQKDYNEAKRTGTYPGSKPDSKFYEYLEECITILKKLFEKRPIWIKRHIDGIIPKKIYHTLKIALALVSYRFSMGPWRNTYIKFGIDPRSSSEYAQYQTEYFKIERKLLQNPMVKKNIPEPPELCFQSNVPDGIDTRFKLA